MIKGFYYTATNEHVPATLIEELSWANDPAIISGKRVLLSIELDGQIRILTAGEITKEEIAEVGIPADIPKGRFIREYVEIPSNDGGQKFSVRLGMESIGVNYVAGHGDFGIILPDPDGNNGKKIFIKDASGLVDSAGGDRIIIERSPNLIQGAEFAVIESEFGFFEFISDGTQWLIVSAG